MYRISLQKVSSACLTLVVIPCLHIFPGMQQTKVFISAGMN